LYLILYQHEFRKKDGIAIKIFQCKILKFNSNKNKFELNYQFLADILQDHIPFSFNIAYINEDGIYFLKKTHVIINAKTVC